MDEMEPRRAIDSAHGKIIRERRIESFDTFQAYPAGTPDEFSTIAVLKRVATYQKILFQASSAFFSA